MMILFWFFLSLGHAQDICVDCIDPLRESFGASTNLALDQIAQIAACNPPAVGASIKHDQRGNTENKIPNDSRYVLRHPSEKQWEIEFNASFTATAGVTEAQAVQMRQRTEACFAQASTAMAGPGDNKLRMKLRPVSGGTNPVAPLIAINVIPSGRGNATNFAATFDCATIVHEFLHHAGLCDEYAETNSTEIVNASSCRAIVPSGSIMSQEMIQVYDETVGATRECRFPEGSAWRTIPRGYVEIAMAKSAQALSNETAHKPVFDAGWCLHNNITPTSANPLIVDHSARFTDIQRGWSMHYPSPNIANPTGEPLLYRLNCQCPANNADCSSAIANLRTAATELYNSANKSYRCPYGISESVPSVIAMAPGILDDRANGRVVIRNRPSGKSLLHPAHFSRLLRGSCRSQDSKNWYDVCARYAYRHSEPDGLNGNCSSMPVECRDPRTYLGGDPVTVPR
jgi:hypothetical protein